ncbi:YetF domain-containing protein [Paenibacillus turpanensis]|uniref:YetF domain-containing protein n=1 Tax=Paenibacillus turpanensis TaxID=2689078 RepID=UPI00140A056C|nr:YetF domain-containing protein [Paenibacillus turpanensis]
MEDMDKLFDELLRLAALAPLLLGSALFLGKRKVSELPASDFMIMLVLGVILGATIVNPAIHPLYPIAAAAVLLVLHLLFLRMLQGIMETNGTLTMKKRKGIQEPVLNDGLLKGPAARSDDGSSKDAQGMHYPVIVEGKIYKEVLEYLDLDENWLKKVLSDNSIRVEQVTFASINEERELHISVGKKGEPRDAKPPTLVH